MEMLQIFNAMINGEIIKIINQDVINEEFIELNEFIISSIHSDEKIMLLSEDFNLIEVFKEDINLKT